MRYTTCVSNDAACTLVHNVCTIRVRMRAPVVVVHVIVACVVADEFLVG